MAIISVSIEYMFLIPLSISLREVIMLKENPKSNLKIVERGKMNTSLSWLGTGSSIKSGRVELVLLYPNIPSTNHDSEMEIQPCINVAPKV
jgi:hypothetical protein